MAAFARRFNHPACEKRRRSASANARPSAQKSQADEPHHDQINRHDDVQQPRNDEDEDAGNEGDDRLQMIDGERHGVSPGEMATTETPSAQSGSSTLAARPDRNQRISAFDPGEVRHGPRRLANLVEKLEAVLAQLLIID